MPVESRQEDHRFASCADAEFQVPGSKFKVSLPVSATLNLEL
jgi:hypothetical protein